MANPSCDSVRDLLSELVRARQSLRREEADRSALEANRKAIAYWQRRLSELAGAEREPLPTPEPRDPAEPLPASASAGAWAVACGQPQPAIPPPGGDPGRNRFSPDSDSPRN